VTIVLYGLAGLICLKILWNLCVPYALALGPVDANTGTSRRISLMPIVEVALLLLMLAATRLASASSAMHDSTNVAVVGVIMIVGSYVHLVLAPVVVGWIAANVRRRREIRPDRDPSS
jgi:hypothetical protein